MHGLPWAVREVIKNRPRHGPSHETLHWTCWTAWSAHRPVEDEERYLIDAYGLFWNRHEIDWRPGGGVSWQLLGHRGGGSRATQSICVSDVLAPSLYWPRSSLNIRTCQRRPTCSRCSRQAAGLVRCDRLAAQQRFLEESQCPGRGLWRAVRWHSDRPWLARTPRRW